MPSRAGGNSFGRKERRLIEAPEYVPLGSVVSLEGNNKKVMVIGRVLILGGVDEGEYYDYAFCLYPEGMLGDAVIYSNHEAIKTVHFSGFHDDEDAQALERIREALARIDVPRAHPQPLDPW